MNEETILSFNMWKKRKEYFSFQVLRKTFRKQHFLFKKNSHFTWPTHESNKTSKTLNNKCIKVSKLSKRSNLNGSHKGYFGICQGGRTWQAFGGGKNGHETFRQARIYNFCDKCVVFACNLKFSNLTQ